MAFSQKKLLKDELKNGFPRVFQKFLHLQEYFPGRKLHSRNSGTLYCSCFIKSHLMRPEDSYSI